MQTANERQLNIGLLLMRLAVAATMLVHALPKLMGGARSWIQVGRDLHFMHPDIPLHIVGIVLLLFQVLGSLGMITGGLFHLSAVLLTIVYCLYFIDFFSTGYKTLPLYAAALAGICIGLMITGPGRFAVALKIERK